MCTGMCMCIGEVEDDATLTADDEDSEVAESADLTPHGRHYQPSIDLTRFQKLIESEERTDSSTREETHRHKMPQTSHATTSYKPTEMPHSGQRGEHDDENSSVDGMSELSSIPPETDGRVNVTVDSEASSVRPIENFTKESVQPPAPVHLTVCRGGASEQPIPPLVAGRDGDSGHGQVEGEKKRHQVVMSSSLTQHPLHVAHRMAPSSHKKTSLELERDTEQGHQDKVHSQLHTLEQVGICYIISKFHIFMYMYSPTRQVSKILTIIVRMHVVQNVQNWPNFHLLSSILLFLLGFCRWLRS